MSTIMRAEALREQAARVLDTGIPAEVAHWLVATAITLENGDDPDDPEAMAKGAALEQTERLLLRLTEGVEPWRRAGEDVVQVHDGGRTLRCGCCGSDRLGTVEVVQVVRPTQLVDGITVAGVPVETRERLGWKCLDCGTRLAAATPSVVGA